jgi:hypothetical protein
VALEVGFDGERFTFPMRDAGGALVGVVRYLPGPWRVDGQPKSLADADSIRALFPWPVGEREVWLVEGEPDAVTAHSAGLPAISVPGTQGWKIDYAERFRGADVVIVMDSDDYGRRAAKGIAAHLAGVAASVRVLDLEPERTDGFDLGDALCEDAGTVEELRQAGSSLRERAAAVEPERAPEPDATTQVAAIRRAIFEDAHDTRAGDQTLREPVPGTGELLQRGVAVLLFAERGHGKTTVAARTATRSPETGSTRCLTHTRTSGAIPILSRRAASWGATTRCSTSTGSPSRLARRSPGLATRL